MEFIANFDRRVDFTIDFQTIERRLLAMPQTIQTGQAVDLVRTLRPLLGTCDINKSEDIQFVYRNLVDNARISRNALFASTEAECGIILIEMLDEVFTQFTQDVGMLLDTSSTSSSDMLRSRYDENQIEPRYRYIPLEGPASHTSYENASSQPVVVAAEKYIIMIQNMIEKYMIRQETSSPAEAVEIIEKINSLGNVLEVNRLISISSLKYLIASLITRLDCFTLSFRSILPRMV